LLEEMLNMKNDTNYALKISNATVIYPDGESTVTALDNADLATKPGEMTAIVGESGSGKSTLLSVAAGLVSPNSGSVEVAGIDLTGADDKTRSQVRRDHIGVIFQQANLIASLTVREQLLIMDHIRGVRMRPSHADELLDLVGLDGMGNRRMAQLSGGQRQRVNIARALMADPELSQEIMGLIVRLTREMNTATVMVTHDRSLLDFVDQAVEVHDGRVNYAEVKH